ncbi:MAG: RidA family protein [Thermoanaerobaculia bacterium]|nr:RidA family protein [Thermoanaerobaculia bacterium]
MQYHATDDAPKAIGPYSQAVSRGEMIFTSGQIPLDPATGELIAGDFDSMVRRVFENLRAVLHAAGVDFQDVVRTSVYMTDLAEFPKLNSIYEEYMGEHRPARSTIGVAALPKGAPVEIDMIAMRSS